MGWGPAGGSELPGLGGWGWEGGAGRGEGSPAHQGKPRGGALDGLKQRVRRHGHGGLGAVNRCQPVPQEFPHCGRRRRRARGGASRCSLLIRALSQLDCLSMRRRQLSDGGLQRLLAQGARPDRAGRKARVESVPQRPRLTGVERLLSEGVESRQWAARGAPH